MSEREQNAAGPALPAEGAQPASETPRTNARYTEIVQEYGSAGEAGSFSAMYWWAQGLERELSAAKAELDEAQQEALKQEGLRYREAQRADNAEIMLSVEQAKLKSAPLYGYGIVDREGNAYFNAKVCSQADSVRTQVNQLNCFGPCAPYRVVRLVVQEIEEKKDG